MYCKNCEATVESSANYCPNCGARFIHNRLSVKILWEDLSSRFLDYDNTFLVTFAHLFTKPEQVIEGYLSGLRKRYMNPLSYFGVALSLSGILLFVTQKVADRINWDLFEQGLNPELTAKLTSIVFDFSSFIFLFFIPIFAFSGWLAFNKKNYFFSEFVIAFIFMLGHWSIATFVPVLCILLLVPNHYMDLSFPSMVFMGGYAVYCLQRINRYPAGKLLLRTAFFSILVFIGYVGLVVLFYAILFATGTVTLEDFRPVR